jgi:hypothetical protein
MAEPPGSAAALAPQIGSLYQVAPTNGLSTLPPVELLVLELEELELLLEDELLDEEELLEDELLEELELEAPELEDELEELEELEPPEELPLIEPVEAVNVTRSSLAPSSRLSIRSVCAPAARLLKVAGVIVP